MVSRTLLAKGFVHRSMAGSNGNTSFYMCSCGATKWLRYIDAWNHSKKCTACEPVQQEQNADVRLQKVKKQRHNQAVGRFLHLVGVMDVENLVELLFSDD
jgi:hypothetical protein